jgi:hypothetical protein
MEQQTIDDIRQKLADIFDQVSVPLYYDGEGPFFMATRELGDDVKFFVYEVNDVETFLADPEKMPLAFVDAAFLFSSADKMDLSAVEMTEREYKLFMLRLVPDSAASRLAIQQLNGVNPDQVLNIALLDEEGKIIPAVNVVDSPVLLM